MKRICLYGRTMCFTEHVEEAGDGASNGFKKPAVAQY